MYKNATFYSSDITAQVVDHHSKKLQQEISQHGVTYGQKCRFAMQYAAQILVDAPLPMRRERHLEISGTQQLLEMIITKRRLAIVD